MTPLIRFLLLNLAGGLMLGIVTGLAFLQASATATLLVDHPLAAGMVLWSFAASFGMGAIATGLALLPYD